MKLKIFFFVIPLLFLLLLLFQKDMALNEDLGRHIKLGEIITQCYCVPQTNLFSYTYPDFSWVTNSWLSAVVFFSFYNYFGLQSLLVLKTLLILISIFILYTLALKKARPFWVLVVSIFAISLFYIRFSVRPELFSYVFIALFLYLIEEYREKKKDIFLWLLIPLELLWVNLHIYFIFGITLYVLFLIEKLYQSGYKAKAKYLFILSLLSGSTLINPTTLTGALLPFTIFNNYGGNVIENHSVFTYFSYFGESNWSGYTISFILFELLLLVMAIFAIILRKKLELFHVLTIGLGSILGLFMIRTIPVFAFFTFIPLTYYLTYIDVTISNKVNRNSVRALCGIVICIIFSLYLKDTLFYNRFGLTFQQEYANSISFLERAKINGPIFNSYANGAYITFRLYPKEKVFIDARAEAYPASFIQDYEKMLTDTKLFYAWDKKYQFNSIVFTNEFQTKQFLRSILQDSQWIPVYTDMQGSIIFVRNSSSNQSIITKYQIKEPINIH